MSDIKERPIIFGGEMVRAIIDGRKTQTRRVVKPKRGCPIDFIGGVGMENDPTCWGFESDDAEWWALKGDEDCHQIPCPYGQSGDQLWVREAHAFVPESAYRCSTGIIQKTNPADDYQACVYRENFDRSRNFPWRPSIHMPRWASRFLLEVVSVRVERLNDISNEDAKAEGAEVWWQGLCADARHPCHTATGMFRELWNSINGAGSWNENPWVWVVEFKRAAS